MDIRLFELKDEADVIRLWEDCNLVVPWNDPAKDIRRKMRVDPDLFLVGELSGLIIASVMGGYEGHRGWVNYLAVSPSHRQKGYARKLMEYIELCLKDKGAPKINLQVRKTNTGSIEFYKNIGYVEDNSVGLGKRLIDDE